MLLAYEVLLVMLVVLVLLIVCATSNIVATGATTLLQVMTMTFQIEVACAVFASTTNVISKNSGGAQ